LKKLRFVLLALMFTAACFLEGAQSLSSSRINVRGAITRITRAGEEGRSKALARVLIEGVKEPDTQVDKAVVDVTAETRFFIKQSGESKPTELATLKEGQRVEALFTGPVRESYPVQATAAEITILEE
jgi:beta-N-acetylhexosaminidase